MTTECRRSRKTKKGIVKSNKMDKTVVVEIETTYRHPQYSKVVTRRQKLYAHNELRPLQIGETVEVMETRPLSKLKRWLVVA